jgi:hypothetical protein
MSRNTKNTNAIKKPHCKVCFDAGKPESEYSSHWTRSLPDRSGKTTVTCPTLLNTECRYCYKLGHTVKFCPAIKQNEKEKERTERRAKAEDKKPIVEEKKKGSIFAGLMDSDSDEEEEKVSKPVENFPVLFEPVKVEKEVKTGWAAIAAKPAPPAPKLVRNETIKSNLLLSDVVKLEAPKKVVETKVAPWVPKTPVITKSWADWSDSEDEDDLEEPNWERENDNYDPYKPYAFGVAEEDETW